jgi:hypothetical protein
LTVYYNDQRLIGKPNLDKHQASKLTAIFFFHFLPKSIEIRQKSTDTNIGAFLCIWMSSAKPNLGERFVARVNL